MKLKNLRLNLHGIATKLILFILTGCLIIFAILFGYNYYYSKKIIFRNIQEIAENRTVAAVNEISAVLKAIQELPENMAYLLEHVAVGNTRLLAHVKTIVENNPEIYGMAVAFEPYISENKKKKYSPYYYKDNGVHFKDLADVNYDYTKWDWFRIPKNKEKALWGEPYYDEGGGNIMMATYSVPFYTQVNHKRLFHGVVTADITLVWLENIIDSIKIAGSGYAFIISKDGYVMHHPKMRKGEDEKLPKAEDIINEVLLDNVLSKMRTGKSGFASLIDKKTDAKVWVSFAPIRSSNWSVGIVFPREELMAATIGLHRTVVMLGFLEFVILFCVIALIASSITHPLRLLARKTNEMSAGNLDIQFPETKSKDEVGVLSRSFINMRDSLKKYILELTETTSEKQRMESELEIAKHIQMSMVPRIFPPFPDKKELELFAKLVPAKQVGGDLYDYFFLDDDHLCLMIGDVAGKGVPAALFMAKSVTLLKVAAKEMSRPSDILQSVNSELVCENDSCIFVTTFLAILNVKTGELNYANGGHNPPILLRQNREVQLIDDVTSPALGAIKDSEYVEGKTKLLEGDVLFMYTDGVTEAFDKENNEFSNERLIDEIVKLEKLSVKKIIYKMFEIIKLFSEGAGQSDDVTMLAVRYLGNRSFKNMNDTQNTNTSIVLKNEIGELIKLTSAINSFGKSNDITKEVLSRLELAIEEIFTNIISYGYKDDGIHSIKIDIECVGNKVNARIEDDAIPFNPLEVPDVDVEKPLKERAIGGLGLHLVKQMVDDISYNRVDGKNILRIACKV